TGQSRDVLTTQAGTYSFTDALPGNYTVTISAPGFRTAQVTNVSVTINTVVRVDVQLQVGAITDTIVQFFGRGRDHLGRTFLVSVQGSLVTVQLRFPRFRGFVLQSDPPEAVELLQRPSVGSAQMDIVTEGRR